MNAFRQRDSPQRSIHKKDMTRDCCCTPHLHHILCSAHTYTCATSRWVPVILDLHRFFIGTSRAVVNHDGGEGTAPDPMVWSAGAHPKRRRLVHAVRDWAFLPGPPGVWESEWVNIPASAFCAEDIALWPCTPGLLVKFVSFLNSLH